MCCSLAAWGTQCCRDLSQNRLTGPLPPRLFSGSSQLEVAYLSDNCFTGALPDPYASAQVSWGAQCALGVWSRARGILPQPLLVGQAHSRGLSHMMPCATACGGTRLLQVKSLALGNNSLSGAAFPASWLEAGALPKLERLDLSYNRALNGTLPANLSCPHLEML